MAKQSIFAYLGINTDDFQKGMGKAKKQMTGFEKAGASFAKNIGGLFAGAFAVDAIISFGQEASELAGKLTGVEAAFKKIDNGGLLKNLRAATKGTVSDLELMQNAVKAENLGLPVEQLGTYFEFARRTAKATGESVDFLVQSIVTGIGRKSPLILDNLGISTVQLNEALKKTPDFATAVGIVIEEKMAKAGDDIDTAAESSAQLAARWDNAKTKAGGLINKGLVPLQDSLSNVIEGMDGLFESNQSFEQFIGNYTKAWTGVTINVKSFEEQLTSLIKVFDRLSLEQLRSEKGLRAFAEAMIKMGVTTEEAIKKYKELVKSKSIVVDNKPQIRTVALIEEEIALQNELIKGVSNRAGAIVIQERITKLEKEKESILGNTKALKDQIKALEELTKKRTELYKRWKSENLNSALFGVEETEISWDDFKITGDKPKGLLEGIGDDIEMPDFYADLEKDFDKVNTKAEALRNGAVAAGVAINETFKTIAKDGLATFGAALGTAFAGGDVFAVGMAFAQTIADSIGSLGKQLIQIGFVMTGIMETLKTAGWANPALLIGGGIALVALSSAMKGMMGSPVGFADGGLVTGSVFANIGEGIGTTSANPEVIAPLDKLKNFINPSGGGMVGGDVKFRIEGNTLVGILDRQQKTSKYSR